MLVANSLIGKMIPALHFVLSANEILPSESSVLRNLVFKCGRGAFKDDLMYL